MELTAKQTKNFWKHVKKTDDCWIWTGATSGGGYGCLTIGHKRYTAHRLSYLMAFGEIQEGMEICHTCDNPPCVNPDHLFCGSRSDNANDMVRKHRHGLQNHPERAARGKANGRYTHPEQRQHGEENGASKLTTAQVIDIREQHANGATQTALAKLFGVSRGAIRQIIYRLSWRHV